MASKKQIDKDTFEKLCHIQCTQEEICDFLQITDKTLTRWIKDTYGKDASFSEIFRQKRSGGKISLRRNQWRLSENNVAMAIWLGKQYLDQKEQSKVENVQIDGPVFVDDE